MNCEKLLNPERMNFFRDVLTNNSTFTILFRSSQNYILGTESYDELIKFILYANLNDNLSVDLKNYFSDVEITFAFQSHSMEMVTVKKFSEYLHLFDHRVHSPTYHYSWSFLLNNFIQMCEKQYCCDCVNCLSLLKTIKNDVKKKCIFLQRFA